MHLRLLTLCLSSLLLTACGDDAPSSAATQASTPSHLTGHVSNDDGFVANAQLEAKDANGNVIAKTDLSGNSRYSLTIPAGTPYPLLLNARTPTETLKAAVASPLVAEQDVSPVSTLIADTALSLGGINAANLTKAAGAAISLRKKSGGSSGGAPTTETFNGDPTKQHGGWH